MNLSAFEEIVGHAGVLDFLSRIQETGRIAPGLLLHGARGRGKSRIARAFARRLFCVEGTGCGVCHSCREFLSGNHPDLETVALADGKSRIAIAQIRELRERFSLAPFEATRRIAIIDDAHLMTEEAQNSLLKLLEEPPGHGLIMLVTPDPGGLLETVHSRLQALHVGPLSDGEIVEVLRREAEIDAVEARRILPLARGSAGTALQLLRDDRTALVIEAALRLFDLKTLPFSYAETVSGGRAGGQAARDQTTRVLEAAAELLSRRIAIEARGEAPGSDDVLAGKFRPPVETLEKIQDLLLEAMRDVGRNVSPRTLLEALKIRLHRELGRARRATVGGAG